MISDALRAELVRQELAKLSPTQATAPDPSTPPKISPVLRKRLYCDWRRADSDVLLWSDKYAGRALPITVDGALTELVITAGPNWIPQAAWLAIDSSPRAKQLLGIWLTNPKFAMRIVSGESDAPEAKKHLASFKRVIDSTGSDAVEKLESWSAHFPHSEVRALAKKRLRLLAAGE